MDIGLPRRMNGVPAEVLEEPSFYKRVMEEMARAMYFNLKNGDK